MRAEKTAIANEIQERLEEAEFFILADYQGLTVSQTELLRKQLGQTNARMMVVRNRQFVHVAKRLSVDGLGDRVLGPTAMFYGAGDMVETSKVLKSFMKANEKPAIKLGSIQGKVVSAAEVEQIADLPSREQMLGTLVGTVAAPMTQLVGVINQKLSSLIYVLKAVQEKKEASA